MKYDQHFVPTDWLGLLINALIYYEVHSDESMMKNLPAITKAVDIHYKLDKPEEALIDSVPTGAY